MHSTILNQIEEMVGCLSRREQLRLIEQLAHRLREGSKNSDVSRQSNSQLVAMAADAEVQAELQKIDHEFGVTEADGLESSYNPKINNRSQK